MARTGTWVLTAGLALLAIGIFSAPKTGGESHERVQILPLTGITALNLNDLGVGAITLDQVDDLQLKHRDWHRYNQDVDDTIVTEINGEVLHLAQGKARSWISFELTVPVWLENFEGNSFSMQAMGFFRQLSLEGQRLTWIGGTGNRLEVKLKTARIDTRCATVTAPKFEFKRGTIEQLHVYAEEGTVILENIDQVADIELEIGPDVHIQARQRDLSRLRIVLLDVDPVASTMNRLLACQHDATSEDLDHEP